MPDVRVARRYAAALFNVVVRENLLDTVERDLQNIIGVWGEHSQIDETMAHPRIPTPVKQRILRQLLEAQVSPITLNFLLFLLDKQRLDLLLAIEREFQRLSDEHRKLVRAYVTTAVPLPEDQADLLRQHINRETGLNVVLVPTVDPRIIGGVIVRVGDRLWDGSIRGYLSDLRQTLAGTRY
ncbi:MAG: ATP synthase F1 subunit delta [Armatimonadetes bacterium]|nr:ATP synthase F1 subunit delta [Armatimonadota bacterium]